MTIRSLLFAVFLVFIVLLGALVFPYHRLHTQEQELFKMIGHAQNEGQAVADLLIALSRKIKETSDAVFLGDEVVARDDLEKNVAAAFVRLKRSAIDLDSVSKQNHDHELAAEEAVFYYELLGIYAEMKKSRHRIELLQKNGETEQALFEMEHVYEYKFDHEFLPVANHWIEEEKEELAVSYEHINQISAAYLLNIKIAMFSAVIVLLVLFYIINRLISGRIADLARATRVIAGGNLNTKVVISGKDEIASLGLAFNEMVDHLAFSRRRLMDQCYLAGVNQSSSDILHNIRNSFSSLTLGCEHITGILNVPAADAEQQAAMIEKLKTRIGKMKNVVSDMAEILESRDDVLLTEGSMERSSLRDLINDSMNLLDRKFFEKIHIYVDPSVNSIGKIMTHRIIFIQILSNLMANACESISRRSVNKGLVRVSAFIDDDDANMVHIFLADNGAGIAAEDLDQIFVRHFSNKPRKGLTGLGLSWCANAVTSLNGKLYAESEGPDKGATFHFFHPQNDQLS